jgi:Acyl-CoA synthetases (AMP-forming)/AMP-acid ligases II
MGTFNDNFFKQAALLLAVAANLHAIQGVATFLFALPFVLFSAWTGWLADRLPKKDIVVASKLLELVAMALGLWALLSLNWVGIVTIVCLMGLQSTLFSPALNGAIPENFPAREVPKVNALLKLATTVTILLGIALGGIVLDLPLPDFARTVSPEGIYSFGRLAVGGCAVLVSVVGLLAAFGIHRTPAPIGGGGNPFPWFGPVDSVRHALECRNADRPLFLALAGEAFFYSLSSFVVLVINNLGIHQMGLSLTWTSLLSVALMVGICIGSLMAGRHEAASWRRFMIPAGTGMAVGLIVAGLVPYMSGPVLRFVVLALVFTLTGICGGFYLIPLVSFIQIRPKATEKGKVLGVANFASFTGIILSGLIFMAVGDISPALLLVAGGAVGLIFMTWAAVFLRHLPTTCLADKSAGLLALILQALLSLRYRVFVTGLADIPVDETEKKPILFMPNHPALIDPSIIYSLLAGFRPRPLVDERQMRGPLGALAAKLIYAVLIPDPGKDGINARQGVEKGLHAVMDALQNGEHVLLYPSGKVYRSAKEYLGANSGAASLLAAMPELRVVLIRTTGLWGSSFSYAAERGAPDFMKVLLRGMLTIASNLFFFTPRREVRVECVEHPDVPRDGDKKTLNAWLEDFYNKAERAPVAVPRFFWQSRKPIPLPEYIQAGANREAADTASVTPELREAVYTLLRRAANLTSDYVLTESMTLGGDLGLDSLALMDLALELEAEHNKSISDMEALATVGDCLAVVAGTAAIPEKAGKPAPATWFTAAPVKSLHLPKGVSRIPDAFMAVVRQAPNMPLVADRSSLRTRRDILTGALVLAERFKTLPGKRVGIMLPSVPAAVPVWLAVQLAGKEAVFFNWTVGEGNLRHCIGLAGVRHIISASALLDRLERGGLPVQTLPVTWLRLENLAASLTRLEKLMGFVRGRLRRSCSAYPVADVAAVLFTSGSESLPKAVPLTHANLLTNAKDIIDVLRVEADEAVLAMLPPFHSFGLMVGLVLPLSLGLKAAFHANPTETEPLVLLVRDYKLTLLASPPTFLEAMLDKAKRLSRTQGTSALASLRFAFAGAEKCPEHVYRAFAEACPAAALCEGYGITECSPVVSVNRPDSIVPGSIGHVLTSVTTALVREEDGQIQERAQTGETGMLLVRGPSIFGGYIGDAPNPFVDFEGHTWYRTGDLISMDETGRLTFRGRLKRFVKIGGEMISLPQIESILLETFSQYPGAPKEGPVLAVEASPEEMGAEIVVFTPLALTLLEVNAALRSAGLSALYHVKRVIAVEAIPLLGSGKTDYRLLQGQLKG